MKIQGMGNLEGYYQKAAKEVNSNQGKAARFKGSTELGSTSAARSQSANGVATNGVEKGISDQRDELVAKQVQVQELIKKQEESMKMMKNLLFLITPGMGDLLEQGEKANTTKDA